MKEASSKKRWYDIALLLAIFLLTCSIPFSLFIKDTNIVYWLKVSLRLVFLVFAFFYVEKNQLEKPRFEKPSKASWLFLPFLLMCFSNFFAAWIDGQTANEITSPIPLLKDALFYLLVALGEEYVFRSVIYPEFKKGRPLWKAMLYSSLVFALPHLFNATSWSTLGMSALQMVYSFLLGILLCALYETSSNIILPIALHFLFDFLNDALVGTLYPLPWDLAFYLSNVIVAIGLAIYFVFLYYLLFYKNKPKTTEEEISKY
jgi:membrane protease YdiL (CAAX protease family)